MRRWNGWGDENTHYPFLPSAKAYLAEKIGPGGPTLTTEMATILRTAPPTRLKEHPGLDLSPLTRLQHACGQSFSDWIALRYGVIPAFPDGVVFPHTTEEVREWVAFAANAGISLIPYGGGTSVVGHINPLPGDRPSLTIDLSRMSQLLVLDETSRLATFEAGVNGPALESALQRHGYTLGHFPQSFELSTLGGWIATRSSGQQSYYYGRIEDLFAGGQVETPAGPLTLPNLPASAAGPDLRQLLLGSEGRLGILTSATVRIRPRPAQEAFYGFFFHNWEAGVQAVRQLVQSGLPVSMARLSNPLETETTLRLSGKDRLVSWAKRGLSLAGYTHKRCLLILGITAGDALRYRSVLQEARRLTRQHGGLFTSTLVGHTWRKARFLTPYLRNSLWEHGYAVDTLETAVPWTKVETLAQSLLDSLHHGLEAWNERVLAFAHLSHIYPDGASIYLTYLFRLAEDPAESLARWQQLKSRASQVIVAHGGTISHQHGVGLDHAPYLPAEKGELGLALLRQAAHTLDPQGIMNPGKCWQ